MVIFNSYVSHYQRVTCGKMWSQGPSSVIPSPFFWGKDSHVKRTVLILMLAYVKQSSPKSYVKFPNHPPNYASKTQVMVQTIWSISRYRY